MRVTILAPAGGQWADLLADRHAEREAWWQANAGGRVLLSKIVWDMFNVEEGDEEARKPIDLPSQVRIETGFMIEELLAEQFAKRSGWSKPPAIFRDGIGARADGYNKGSRTLDEIKVSWISEHEQLANPKARRYVLLAKGYCAVATSHYRRLHNRIRLHVFYVNWDYRPPRPMPPQTYVLRFTTEEIETAWQGIRQHAVDRGWLKSKGGVYVPRKGNAI